MTAPPIRRFAKIRYFLRLRNQLKLLPIVVRKHDRLGKLLPELKRRLGLFFSRDSIPYMILQIKLPIENTLLKKILISRHAAGRGEFQLQAF